jgi:hypothetical protein
VISKIGGKMCFDGDCKNAIFQDGPMCREHGCHVCGGIILADSDEWIHPLCPECFEEFEQRFGVKENAV